VWGGGNEFFTARPQDLPPGGLEGKPAMPILIHKGIKIFFRKNIFLDKQNFSTLDILTG
jgi:hypothetical protein